MATVWEYTGDTKATAQVDTITVALTWATADTATIRINGKDLVLTVGTDATTDQVATAIKEMFNGDTQTGTGDHTFSETGNNLPEFFEIVATVASSVVTLTAKTAGKSFIVTVEGDGTAGDGTATRAALTANAGNNALIPANFKKVADGTRGSGAFGAVTAVDDTDTIIFRNLDVDLKYNLDALAAIELLAVTIDASYTGVIGLPPKNEDATLTYDEYRPRFLQFDEDSGNALTIKIGEGSGDGSPKIRLEPMDDVLTLTVFSTGSSEDDKGALEISGDQIKTISTASIQSGSVDFWTPNEGGSSIITTANIGGDSVAVFDARAISDVLVFDSADVTLNDGSLTLTQFGGTVAALMAVPTATIAGGTLNLPAIDTFTITTLNIGARGTVDTAGSTAIVTATTLVPDAGATVRASNGLLAVTNAIDLRNSSWDDFNIDLGPGKDYTVA